MGCAPFGRFVSVYWKAIFSILFPLAILPIFLFNNTTEMRCLYIVVLMSVFWVLEIIPLGVTGLIPIVLFPLMGIMDTGPTTICYFKDSNMMFLGGLMIAVAVEYSNLHNRIALLVILTVGCSPRRLNLGLVVVTMFISMWISNAAATAMMCPIIDATLRELEAGGMGKVFEDNPDAENVPEAEKAPPRPTSATTCYYLSVAYAASIGGVGTLIGTATNLAYKGIYETFFPKAGDVEFGSWMLFNVPLMLVTQIFVWLWLQFLLMGLFRPNSKAGQSVKIASEGTAVAETVIKNKLADLGRITFHEIGVATVFVLAVLLWVFTKPEFMPGWPVLITENKVTGSTVAMMMIILMFIVPARPDCFYICSKDEEKRPKKHSSGLLIWKVLHEKVPWGLLFLLGGGFALAEGANKSGMSKLIGQGIGEVIEPLPKYSVLVLTCSFASFFTEFSSNVAIANILLPVLAELSIQAKWHPLFLMMPVAITCSHAFCMPVGTPPNAIILPYSHIRTSQMIKAGSGAKLIALVILIALFVTLGPVLYPINDQPKWLNEKPVEKPSELIFI